MVSGPTCRAVGHSTEEEENEIAVLPISIPDSGSSDSGILYG